MLTRIISFGSLYLIEGPQVSAKRVSYFRQCKVNQLVPWFYAFFRKTHSFTFRTKGYWKESIIMYFSHFVVIVVQLLNNIQCFCDSMDCSLPGSSVRWVFWARVLEWAATSSSGGSSRAGVRARVFCIGRWTLHHWAPGGAQLSHSPGLFRTSGCLFSLCTLWHTDFRNQETVFFCF